MTEPSVKSVSQPVSVPFRLNEPDVAREPGEYYKDLLSRCPVAHSDTFDDGFWVISSYKDVYNASLNADVFSSACPVTIPSLPPPRVICIEQDDPEHRKYRRPLQGWFSVKRMLALEPSIRSVVGSLLDEIVEDGHADLAEVFFNPFPTMAIAIILGLPEDEWTWFRDKAMDRTRLTQEGELEGAAVAYAEILARLSRGVEERRSHPREDMLSDIAGLMIDDEPINHDDAVSLAFLLLGAGVETTASGIGGLLYRVAGDPKLRDQLLDDPALIEIAVEEALRIESPFPGMARTTTASSTVGDVSIGAGERVMLMFGAANRDPAMFEDPDEFRLDRSNVHKQLGFGAGIHRCVGAPFARLQMQIAMEEILRRMPQIRLAGPDGVKVSWTTSREFNKLECSW
ncbi:cytochrome P450 [Nocardioides alcanivorans]|uniref:cytochrome P450 n=1 Tax=Nocardioides alcanivorans TaxID=2897352 RepID=UPI001F4816F2|nr:cytochrome P450 [Nocardioides alcanivorans]